MVCNGDTSPGWTPSIFYSEAPKNTQLSSSWLYFGRRRVMLHGHGGPQHHSA